MTRNRKLTVKVCGQEIIESDDEKLLGITISNNLTWHTHLYGNNLQGKDKLVGLVPQLSQRVGIISKLSKVLSRRQLQNTCSGIFTSKLLYGLPLFSNAWGVPDMDDSSRRFMAFTKDDCRRLQVLQNKTMRIITNNHQLNVPTEELLSETKSLSVNQLGVFHTVMMAFKAIQSGKPKYLTSKLQLRTPAAGTAFPHRQTNTISASCNLTISRSGFFYRAAKVWNLLPAGQRSELSASVFKTNLRSWILQFIPRKAP